MAKALHFDPKRSSQSKEMLDVANRLAKDMQRSPTDAVRIIVVEAGNAKLNHSELYNELIAKIKEIESQSARHAG